MRSTRGEPVDEAATSADKAGCGGHADAPVENCAAAGSEHEVRLIEVGELAVDAAQAGGAGMLSWRLLLRRRYLCLRLSVLLLLLSPLAGVRNLLCLRLAGHRVLPRRLVLGVLLRGSRRLT